jgi:hypothetical protein
MTKNQIAVKHHFIDGEVILRARIGMREFGNLILLISKPLPTATAEIWACKIMPEAGFLARVHPEPCLILSRAQIRALLCSSKSKFIPASTLTLLVLDKKNGLRLLKTLQRSPACLHGRYIVNLLSEQEN